MRNKVFTSFIFIFFIVIFFIFYKGLNNVNIYTPRTDTIKEIQPFKAKLFGKDNLINSNEIFEKDKFYLLNIWASWCIPCKDEHPILLNLSYQDNIEIIGLNYKDNYQSAKKFLKELDSPYKIILSDDDGTLAIELGSYGVPETFLIFNNKIIMKFIGPLSQNSLLEIKEKQNEIF